MTAFATLDAIPRRWAADTPDALALVDRDRRVNWRALQAGIDACTTMLADAAAGAGDRVAIVSENCVELVALLFATSARRACAVVVNPRLSPRELDAIVAHAQPRCIVFVPDTADEVAAHASRLHASSVATHALHTLALSKDTSIPA